ncbi:MAG: pseudaminic acid cytidylyltransferase [Gelidibacter sp.]
MRRLCIIPARGGSKRIPKKNSKDFLGKPIIVYSIEIALNSKLFDEVMVSTDDVEIAKIALEHGAKVPFVRSAENSNDYATTFAVIKEVLSFYQKNNIEFTEACCLYATAPLVSVKNLKKAFSLLNGEKFSTVFPVIRFGFPVQRAVEIIDGQKMKLVFPEHELTRSQDLKPYFHDAGQFYVFNVKDVLRIEKLYTVNSGIFEIPEMEAQDIDNDVDWQMAELKYQLNTKS